MFRQSPCVLILPYSLYAPLCLISNMRYLFFNALASLTLSLLIKVHDIVRTRPTAPPRHNPKCRELPNKPLPKTSHLELLRLILIPNFLIQLIALITSSDLSMFDAELFPLLNDESIINLILKDLSPSTLIDFLLKV